MRSKNWIVKISPILTVMLLLSILTPVYGYFIIPKRVYVVVATPHATVWTDNYFIYTYLTKKVVAVEHATIVLLYLGGWTSQATYTVSNGGNIYSIHIYTLTLQYTPLYHKSYILSWSSNLPSWMQPYIHVSPR